ncbi:MAG: O-antigen ligase family protein [Patescibacteria group bacterium]|jgi:O-antigen ligase/Tfp pilus assembly protein PilF|nr:O-antigen ligase family protein [Patescibacteria group bacterium]
MEARLSNYLLKFLKIGVFVTLFLPLVMNSHFFFPFIVFKNVLFHIAVEVMFVAYLFLASINPRFRPRLDKLTIALVAFFVIYVMAGIFGIGIYSSFWGNYERMSGIFHMFHLVLYFLVVANVFKVKEDWHAFFTFSIFASLLMSFLGLAQWLKIPFLLESSGGSRLSGTVGNATFLAAYLIFNLFFILYFWAKEERFNLKLFAVSFLSFDIFLVLSSILNKLFITSDWGLLNIFKIPILIEGFDYPKIWVAYLVFQALILAVWLLRTKINAVRVLLSAILLLDFFIFFNTQTRGAIIGFVLGVGFLAVAGLVFSRDKKIKAAVAGFLLLAVISPFILLAAKDTSFIQNNGTLSRLANISKSDLTTESRLLTWQASWRGWSENSKSFLIGYGPENYYYAFNKYFPTAIYKDAGSRIWFDRAHNIIFDIGVTTGIIGLVSYLSILALAAYYLVAAYRQVKEISSSWLFVGLLIAYFIQNFFVFDTINTEIPFFLFLGFIVFQYFEAYSSQNSSATNYREINYIYLATLAVVLLFGVLAVNVRVLKSNNYIFKALTGNGDVQIAFDYFKQAIDQSLTGRFEARQQIADFANRLLTNQSVNNNKKSEIISFAGLELKKSIDEEPLNVRHYIFLANFRNSTAAANIQAVQEAADLMSQAIELSPNRPHVYSELAKAEVLLGNFEAGEKWFKQSAALAPWVIDVHWNLLTVYIMFEKYDLADEYMEYMKQELDWQPGVQDYGRLVDLYARVKNYNRMLEAQLLKIEIESTADNYAQLAAIHAKLGQNEQARQATQRAVEINPEFSGQAQQFLQLLDQGELLDK